MIQEAAERPPYFLCRLMFHLKGTAMKITKRILSLCLVLVLGFSLAAVSAYAEPAPTEGELRLISYNIAGLPIPKLINKTRSPLQDAKEIGRQIGAAGYDLLAVQEDFASYGQIKGMLDAPYFSYHKGNVPAGDGLDFFSQYPIYNVNRVSWAKRWGGFSFGAADEYTPKGFSHAVMELAPGVYIDIYNVHANASGRKGIPTDQESPGGRHRKAQFGQLSDYIKANSAGRAVIVFGDFNTYLRRAVDGLDEALITPCSLKDSWAELYNGGITTYTGGAWADEGDTQRDRILFRGSDTVTLTALTAESTDRTDADGRSLSDHASWAATLKYELTGATETIDNLRAPTPVPFFTKLWDYLSNIGRCIGILVTREIPALFGKEM